jgi:hypothetical protein
MGYAICTRLQLAQSYATFDSRFIQLMDLCPYARQHNHLGLKPLRAGLSPCTQTTKTQKRCLVKREKEPLSRFKLPKQVKSHRAPDIDHTQRPLHFQHDVNPVLATAGYISDDNHIPRRLTCRSTSSLHSRLGRSNIQARRVAIGVA